MRLLALLTAVVAPTLLLAAPVPKAKAVKDEEAILGMWQVEVMDFGYDLPAASASPFARMTFTFKEEGVMGGLGVRGEEQEEAYTLDPAAIPKAIDLRQGSSRQFGVYALDGDTLKLCMCAGADARPAEIKADGKSTFVLTLKRVKDEPKKDK